MKPCCGLIGYLECGVLSSKSLFGIGVANLTPMNSNAWSPSDASPAIAFFSAWAPVLPRFLHDNVLDQLILPKISKAVSDWTPKSQLSLHSLVLPWIELAGPRMDEMLGEAKRRVKSWLKNWRPRDGVPSGLPIWRDVSS